MKNTKIREGDYVVREDEPEHIFYVYGVPSRSEKYIGVEVAFGNDYDCFETKPRGFRLATEKDVTRVLRITKKRMLSNYQKKVNDINSESARIRKVITFRKK